MKLYLDSVSGDYRDFEAEVISCALVNNKINILFKTAEDDEPVEGRFSLIPTNETQSSTGYWIYPDTKKESARFSEVQEEQEEEQILSKIKGNLINFRGKKVEFQGIWTDKDDTYDLYIDAKIT